MVDERTGPAATEEGRPGNPAGGAPPSQLNRHVGGVWSPAGFSWSLFEFARNPYYMLVVIYVFAPYFSREVAGGGVEGSARVADVMTWAGVICACTAPLLGAMMDRGGARKPLMGVFLGIIAVCAILLWWSTPTGGLGVPLTMALMVLAFCAYTYSEVMHNAMLPAAGRPSALPHISGSGLALGNLGSVIGLLVVAAVTLNAEALGFSQAAHDPQRFTGPYTGIWLIVFIIPFFLYMPDGAVQGGTWRNAASNLFGLRRPGGFSVRERLGRIRAYVGDLFRSSPDTMKFLLGRMIYADGLTAVMALGGVYTATFLGWSALETALFGIYGSIFAALGGFLGGALDQRFGAKRAIIIELCVVMAVYIGMLSVTQDTVFFGLVPAGHDILGGEIFTKLSDWVYLGFMAVLAMALTACISSSRYMLVAVAPKARIGEFFGFYAMAATLTVWMGPLLYAVISRTFNDQRIGMASLMLLFGAGLAILLTVKHSGRAQSDKG